MANTKISQLTAYTGSASGSFLVMNNSTETTTYKVTRETLLNDYTASYASRSLSSSYAISASFASQSHLLDGYHSSVFAKLNTTNTFTQDLQVIISGSKSIGIFEGDTFFILDFSNNREVGLSNALSDFDGPYNTGIYVSSGSVYSTSSYYTAIEIPAGPDFINPDGLVSIKFPTQITGSLNVTKGITGSILANNGVISSSTQISQSGFISNATDIYTNTPAITNIISLTQAEYNAISSSASSNTLYIII